MKHLRFVLIFFLLATPTAAQDHRSFAVQAILNQPILSHPQSESEQKARLALDYLEGRGVKQSDTVALKWWLISQAIQRPIERITPETPFICGYDMALAEGQLSPLEWTMPHDQIVQAETMAREWLVTHSQ